MFGWPFDAVLSALTLGIAIAFARLLRGPTAPDRVVALDLIATMTVALLAVFSSATGHTAYLDIALTLALVAFLATVAFAAYVERAGARDSGHAASGPTR